MNKSGKNVLFIINPASGREEPILFQSNKFFLENHISADIRVTKKAGDAKQFIKEIQSDYNAVFVYGGDGTVAEAAAEISKSEIPLVVLPGGTANILSKELMFPQNLEQALNIFKTGKVRQIDTFECNGNRSVIGITTGLFAEMITETSESSKLIAGSLAYALSAVKGPIEERNYQIKLGDDTHSIKAAGLFLVNVGNAGIFGVSLHPDINIFDGNLNLLAFPPSELSLFANLTKSVFLGAKNVKYFESSEFEIIVDENDTVLLDDVVIDDRKMEVKVNHKSLSVFVPNE